MANSDAKALARHLAAIGLDITADRLNDLLVLLAVLMIEAGGGVSLALGIALSAAPAGRTGTPVDAAVSEPEQPKTRPWTPWLTLWTLRLFNRPQRLDTSVHPASTPAI